MAMRLLVIGLVVGVLGVLPSESRALTFDEFATMPKEHQLWYLIGILDTEIVDASFGKERTKCVEDWGLKGAYNHLHELYHGEDGKVFLKSNVAFLVGMAVGKVCPYPRLSNEELIKKEGYVPIEVPDPESDKKR